MLARIWENGTTCALLVGVQIHTVLLGGSLAIRNKIIMGKCFDLVIHLQNYPSEEIKQVNLCTSTMIYIQGCLIQHCMK